MFHALGQGRAFGDINHVSPGPSFKFINFFLVNLLSLLMIVAKAINLIVHFVYPKKEKEKEKTI